MRFLPAFHHLHDLTQLLLAQLLVLDEEGEEGLRGIPEERVLHVMQDLGNVFLTAH